MTGRPAAERTMRFALVAIRHWWLRQRSTKVSINCAWMAGARTVRMGSPGKMGVPSGAAQISPVKENPLKYSKNSSEKQPFDRRYAMSSSSKHRFSIYSTTWARPAAMAKPPRSGTER